MADWVELRVHGVSGTPPDYMLSSAHTTQVAGDDRSRCFRPTDAQGRPESAPDGHLLEAFHWGRWTSGSWMQGLWLLLIPFGIVNAAQYMLPAPTSGPSRAARALTGALLRIVALVLTGLFAVTVCLVVVDLVAWQSLVGPEPQPVAGWLLVAAGLALAALLIAALSRLGQVDTGRRYRFASAPARDLGRGAGGVAGLGDAAFFDGDPDSPTLRHLHRACGLSVVAWLGLSVAADAGVAWAQGWRWMPVGLIGLLVGVVFLSGDPERTTAVRTGRAASGAAWARWSLPVAVVLRVLAGSAVLLGLAALVGTEVEGVGRLPGMDAVVGVLVAAGFGGLTLLVLAVAVVAITTSRAARRTPRPFRRFAGGMAAGLASAVGCYLAVGFTAGLTLGVQGLINAVTDESVRAPALLQRFSYAWGVTALVFAGVACGAWLGLRRSRRRFTERARAAMTFGDPPSLRLPMSWVHRVGRAMQLARLKNAAAPFVVVWTVLGLVLAAAIASALWADQLTGPGGGAEPVFLLDLLTGTSSAPGEPVSGEDVIIGIGQATLLGFGGGAVLLARGALRSEGARRGLNVVWDVVAFWPRSTHPFVPPPYAQEVVPALVRRICWHLGVPDPLEDAALPTSGEPGGAEPNPDPAREVVVAAHSQGSLISLVALLWLPPEVRSRVRWLTFGSQLRGQFARGFPHYVDADLLREVAGAFRWISLYRDTDPVAGPVTSWDHTPDGGALRSRRLAHPEDLQPDDVDPRTGRRECGAEWRLLDPVPGDLGLQRGRSPGAAATAGTGWTPTGTAPSSPSAAADRRSCRRGWSRRPVPSIMPSACVMIGARSVAGRAGGPDMAEWVELRVHGVSGTPPESMLKAPVTVQVAGDDLGRFHRAADGAGNPLPPSATGGSVLEGYHWGLFTSGSFTQGLWFLLLPFGMINAASFMVPPGAAPVVASTRAVLRVLGLALTVVLLAGTVHVLVEALAWNGPGGGRWYWMALAMVGCLVVLATITMLGRHQITPPPPGQSGSNSAPDDPKVRELTRLADASFYEREPDAPLLRRLHVAAGLLVVAAPFASFAAESGTAVLTWAPAVGLGLTALGVAALADARGRVGRVRPMPDPVGGSGVPPAGRLLDVGTWLLLGFAGFVLGLALLRALPDLPTPSASDPRLLPGLDVLGTWLVWIGWVLLVALLVLVAIASATADRPADGPAGTPRAFRPYVGGMIAWVVATLGAFLGLGFAVGLSFTASWLLTRTGGRPTELPRIHTWVAFSWGTAGLLSVALLFVALALRGRGVVAQVAAAYRVPHEKGLLGTAEIPDGAVLSPAAKGTRVGRLKWWVGWAGAAFAVLGLVLHTVIAVDLQRSVLAERMGPGTGPGGGLVVAGNVLLVGFAGGLLLAGRGAVLRPGARRVANVVWDVIAFWPRAAHPMAPPPYSQRAVRDFADRITWHLDHGGAQRLLVAGHSQGTLISVAALLRVPERLYGRIALITHGSQLQHAYSRGFPGYINAPLLRWLLRRLDGRWISLYRDTDPVGGPVLSWDRSSEGTGLPWTSTRLTGEGQESGEDGIGVHGVRCCGREWRLLDPAVVDPQRRPWPGGRGHSDIPSDISWVYAVAAAWRGDGACPRSVADQQSDGQPAEQRVDSDPRDV